MKTDNAAARQNHKAKPADGQPIKLLYVANARIPTEKAHGYQILQMCQAFGEADCEVLLLHPKRRTFAADVERYYGLRHKVARRAIPCVDAIGWLPPDGFLIRWFARIAAEIKNSSFALGLVLWFARHGRGSAADIVYTRDLKIAWVLMLLIPSLRQKIFIECHSVSAGERQQRVQAKILARCAGVICMTDAMRRRVIELGVPADRMIVEADAVDLETFAVDVGRETVQDQLGLDQTAVIAAFIGRFHTMEMEKGLPQIIEAAAELLERHPRLTFMFVGGPMDRVPKYEALIDALGLSRDRFLFFDKQPVTEVPRWLSAADILLMPHPETEFYSRDVSPLKMFEYMTAGRPIVASRLPAIMEILQDGRNAVLIPPGDSPGLASAIDRLLSDPSLAQRIAAAANKDVRNYSWAARAARIIEFTGNRTLDACASVRTAS